jgi:hypothetical protein
LVQFLFKKLEQRQVAGSPVTNPDRDQGARFFSQSGPCIAMYRVCAPAIALNQSHELHRINSGAEALFFDP